MVRHGEERFYLKLADTTGGTKSKATVTGLRIPHVTSEFPMLQLQQAWDGSISRRLTPGLAERGWM
jgi:hypothetical protein